jgi:hypothetical protein
VAAGAGFAVTITATDVFGNGCTGVVTLTGDGQTRSVTLTNGVASVPVALRTPGVVTLTASAGGTSGTARISVTPAVLHHFAITGAPATIQAGSRLTATITAVDTTGSTATGYAGTVQVAFAGVSTTVRLTAGRGTISLVPRSAGSSPITVSDGTIRGTSTAITVQPGSAIKFVITSPLKIVRGASFQITITAEDAFGNPVPYSGTVIVQSRGREIPPTRVVLSRNNPITRVPLKATQSGNGADIFVTLPGISA